MPKHVIERELPDARQTVVRRTAWHLAKVVQCAAQSRIVVKSIIDPTTRGLTALSDNVGCLAH